MNHACKLRRELRYGSQRFLAASDWARGLPETVRARDVLASLACRPASARVLADIARLPAAVLLARPGADTYWLAGRWPGNWAWAVLDLTGDESRYLTGRPKQALRTNLRHARDAGITSAVADFGTWAEAAADITRGRGEDPADAVGLDRPTAYYLTRDARGLPLAYAGAAPLGQCAILSVLISNLSRHPEASWARYQLHTFLAMDLGRSGVRHLVAGSALRERPGLQYFQHVLGYRPRNLRMRVAGEGFKPSHARTPDELTGPST